MTEHLKENYYNKVKYYGLKVNHEEKENNFLFSV